MSVLATPPPPFGPLIIVVFAVLLFKLGPGSPIPGDAALHPDVSLVLPYAVIGLDHGAKHHAGHLNVSFRGEQVSQSVS